MTFTVHTMRPFIKKSLGTCEHVQQQHAPHHSAVVGVVKPLQQLHTGALPTATAAHEGQRLAGLHRHVEPVQHLDVRPGRVGELAVDELDVSLEVILETKEVLGEWEGGATRAQRLQEVYLSISPLEADEI